MTEENRRPIKEANRITKLLDLGLDASARYPVNVEKVALELTPSFNADPITTVQAGSMGKIDGMLARHPHKDEWAIFYNQDIAHKGRTNFTLAHELGHSTMCSLVRGLFPQLSRAGGTDAGTRLRGGS